MAAFFLSMRAQSRACTWIAKGVPSLPLLSHIMRTPMEIALNNGRLVRFQML